MTQYLSVKGNKKIKPNVTRAGQSVPKTLMAGINGKTKKSQLRSRCGRCPRIQGDDEIRWGGSGSCGVWSYLEKHLSIPLLTPDLS